MFFAMKKKLRVLIVSPELAPLTTAAGGLGESVRAAAEEAAAQGAAVSIVLPRYRRAGDRGPAAWSPSCPSSSSRSGRSKVKAAAYKADSGGLDVFLIDSAEYFLRDRVYGAEGTAYLDNDARFAFFARAVVELDPQGQAGRRRHPLPRLAGGAGAALPADPLRRAGPR